MDTTTTVEHVELEHASTEQHQVNTDPSNDTVDTDQLLKDELFTIFVGKNVEKFTKRSSNFAVIIAALPWFMYRKMFLFGVASILIPIIIALLFPDLSRVNMGYAFALVSLANPLYAWHAKRKVAKIMNMDISVEEMKERAQKTGGTSVAGATFGTLITGAMLALFILQLSIPSALPQCDSKEARELAHAAITEALTAAQHSFSQLEFADMTPLAEPEANIYARFCSGTANIDGTPFPIFFKVIWDSPLMQNISIVVKSTKEGLTK